MISVPLAAAACATGSLAERAGLTTSTAAAPTVRLKGVAQAPVTADAALPTTPPEAPVAPPGWTQSWEQRLRYPLEVHAEREATLPEPQPARPVVAALLPRAESAHEGDELGAQADDAEDGQECGADTAPIGEQPPEADPVLVYKRGRRFEEQAWTDLRRHDVHSSRYARCPATSTTASVYGIGSSTMAYQLGPQMHEEIESWGVEVRRWGKHSSGLARPDYFDWFEQIPDIIRRHDPDVFVVSLGTNDNQAIREGHHWVRLARGPERWKKTYAARVDKLLNMLSGPDRKRTVIWTGPTAFAGTRAEVYGPMINKIIRDRIKAFDGPAYYVDVFRRTSVADGHLVYRIILPGQSDPIEARAKDGVHLTNEGVRWLIAKPVFDLLRPCMQRSAAASGRAGR